MVEKTKTLEEDNDSIKTDEDDAFDEEFEENPKYTRKTTNEFVDPNEMDGTISTIKRFT